MTSAEGSSALKDPLIGQVVQGRYLVRRIIGRGGMGVVYEAQHLLIGRKVALKVLAARGLLSNASIVRFRREARAAASVGNSHIVDVLDMGKLDDGSLFIVLEYLEGVDLGWAVADARRFSLPRAVAVLCQLCDALAAVHGAGIVHRDLKPENIFLIQRDGQADFVKVLDFGVCRFKDREGMSLTASTDTVGTPLFMAPEQIENVANIDHRTDIYALGGIFYFLLTGRTPFEAPTLPKLWMRICMEPPPRLCGADEGVPAEVDAIIQCALSKSSELRYSSCLDFKRALLQLEGAAVRPSQIRLREGFAATLPANTEALYLNGEGVAASSRAPAVVSGAGGRYSALARASLVAFAALVIALVSLSLTKRRESPSPSVIASRVPLAVRPRVPDTKQEPGTPSRDEGSETSKPPARTPPRRPVPSPRERPSARDEPAISAEMPSVSIEQFPLTPETREPPPLVPTPAAKVEASSAEIRLNQGPKRGL